MPMLCEVGNGVSTQILGLGLLSNQGTLLGYALHWSVGLCICGCSYLVFWDSPSFESHHA